MQSSVPLTQSARERVGRALGPIVARQGLLAQAIMKLKLLERVADGSGAEEFSKDLADLLGDGVLREVSQVTGLNPQEALRQVAEQLLSVAEFAQADGDDFSTISRNIVAVERLVSSGRGQLFIVGA